MTQRSELKARARERMSGKYGTLILAFVIVQGLLLVSSLVSGELFPGDSVLDIVLANVFSFILSLIVNVMSAGMIYMYLNIARGKQYSLNDLMYFYRNHPDRVITASFVFAVINLLTMLPSTIYSYTAQVDVNDINALADSVVRSASMLIIGLLVYEVLVIPMEMAYFILSDHPEMKGRDALKESINLMRGSCGRYLMLKASFIPLMFLSVFTFYIALLWILPYMVMTEAMFYRDLMGELTAEKEEEERAAQDYVNPIFGGRIQEEQPHPQQFWRAPEEPAADSYDNREEQNTADNEEMQSNVQSTNSTEKRNDQEDTASPKEQSTPPAQEEEEDNEPKPWDEYFNSLK